MHRTLASDVWVDAALWCQEFRRWRLGVVLLRLAVREGNALALFELGNCYGDGKGVRKNRKKAIALYRRAARRGERFAEWNIAMTYREIGNDRAMRASLRRAARSGDEDAIAVFERCRRGMKLHDAVTAVIRA